MSTTTEELTHLVRQIVGVQALNGRLWDTADVATFLRLNAAYVRQHILTRRDFPKAIELPGTGKESIKRFRPGDIHDWSEKHRN